VQLINRQLKIVRNVCYAGKCEASAQKRDIANHAVPKWLVRGNLGTPVHFGAVVSSSFGHARILDQKHCVKIKGNVRKMLTVGNQSAGTRRHKFINRPHGEMDAIRNCLAEHGPAALRGSTLYTPLLPRNLSPNLYFARPNSLL